MINRNGAQLASKASLSVPARGFFEALSRWNRVGCGASQTRKYSAKILRNEFRNQQACPRTNLHTCTITASQQRSKSISSLFYTPSPQRSSVEERVPPRQSPASKPSADENSNSQNQSLEQTSPISRTFRDIMRTLPSSVVVLTATKAHSSNTYHRDLQTRWKNLVGMTLSSFTSLSLSPEPIITFNIRYPSSTLAAIAFNKQFLIHILDASPDAARISNSFTMGNEKERRGKVFRRGQESGLFRCEPEVIPDTRTNGKFHTLPRLKGKGIGKVLRCELVRGEGAAADVLIPGTDGWKAPKPSGSLMVVGDHILVLARVVEILDGPKIIGNAENEFALSYVGQRYRKVGAAISLEEEQIY